MTESDIQRLFVQHPFGEAKRILVEEIEKSGRELTGNENVFELRAIALECSRYSQSVSNEVVNSQSAGGNTGGSVVGSVGNENGGETGEESAQAQGGESSAQGAQSEQKAAKAPQNASGAETPKGGSEGKEKNGENANADPNQSGQQSKNQKQNSTQIQQNFINELMEAIDKKSNNPKRKKRREAKEEEQKVAQSTESQQETNNHEAKEEKNESENQPQGKKKSEEELESEANELMKEARQKIEEANRMREERKKKEEEERKKREQERQKNDRHYMTDEVVKRLKTLHKAFLVGPAGTGKSTLAMCACRELFGIEGTLEDVVKSGKFAQISFSPDTVSADMLGFTDVNGVFHETEIIRVFRDGGLILFDEMDDADASLLVKLNTMLANRVIPIPGKMVVQNPNTYIVGTANTYGKGGNSMYVGRSRLDGATLDRWKMSTIRVGYDTKLESRIIGRDLWMKNQKICHEIKMATTTIRNLIENNKWKQICSTRFVIDSVEMAKAGYSWIDILNTFLLDWDDMSAKKVRDAFKETMKGCPLPTKEEADEFYQSVNTAK